MQFYTQKYNDLISSLNGKGNSGLPDSAFLVSANEQISSGHSISGVFCHTARSINDNSLARICDFIIYENSKDRKPCIAIGEIDEMPEIRSLITERLNHLPKPNSIRASDPRWLVHATSLTNGKAIIADRQIKSQKRVINEKYFSNYQLGYSQLQEPTDYLDHVNFAVIDSIWPEVVVSSNQSGNIGDFDASYNPGFRFYIDAHALIKSGLALRTGAPFLKVMGELNLNNIINHPVSVEIFDKQPWTPKTFTMAANEMFAKSGVLQELK